MGKHDDKPLGSFAALKQQATLPKNQVHPTVNHRMAQAFAQALKEKEVKEK